jgi:twinkle protein
MIVESPKELAQLLAQDAQGVCEYLWPNGKREGKEWRVGDVHGGAGHSLACELSGAKAGMFCDWAFKDEHRGDLLDAWALRFGLSISEAMTEVRNYLGVSPPPKLKKPKTYATANRPPASKAPAPESPVMAYLHGRGLTDETIKAFHILEQPNSFYDLPDNPADIVFPYLIKNPDGKLTLINNKYLALQRVEQKNGSLKKRIRLETDCKRILFGWHLIKPDARKVLLTEGEVDCATWHQFGVPALSVPNGAGGEEWVEDESDNLSRFDEIFINFDMDEPGENGAISLIKRLGRHRCRLVKLPHKDINECLMQGITTEQVLNCLRQSAYLSPEEFITFREGVELLKERMRKQAERNGEPEGLMLPWSKASEFFMVPNHLTVWTGFGGHGKTSLLSHILAYAIHQPGQERACIASLEMSADETIDRLCKQLAGRSTLIPEELDRLSDAIEDRCVIYHHVGSSNIKTVLEVFKYARQRHGVTQFVVDSLMMLGISYDDYDKQVAAAQALIGFAREHQVHVHLVIHPKKPSDENKAPTMYDVKGSGGLVDMAHNVVVVWRNKEKFAAQQDEKINGTPMDTRLACAPDTTLSIQKNRFNGWLATIPLWFHRESQQFLEGPTELPIIYVHPEGF